MYRWPQRKHVFAYQPLSGLAYMSVYAFLKGGGDSNALRARHREAEGCPSLLSPVLSKCYRRVRADCGESLAPGHWSISQMKAAPLSAQNSGFSLVGQLMERM